VAVRIRKDGKIFCAAMHKKEDGDIYINDKLHYYLSVEQKILVTQDWQEHKKHGQWWWLNQVPKEITIGTFYKKINK
jgi:hypothetical protein